MAGPLTWQQVAAPDFSGSARAYESAGNLINSGFGNLAEALGKYQTNMQNQAGSQLLANAAQHKDLASLQGAISDGSILNGVDRSMVPMDAWKTLDSHATNLISNATSQEALNTNLRTQDSRVDLAAAQPGLVRSQTALDNATAGHTIEETNYNKMTEKDRQAGLQAGTSLNNANAGSINQQTNQRAQTFPYELQGKQDEFQGQGTAQDIIGKGKDLESRLYLFNNSPEAQAMSPGARKVAEAAIRAAPDAGGTTLSGAPVPSISVPGLPTAGAGDWIKKVALGSDSSGAVSLDRLHPEVKDGLANLTQLYGPVKINSSDGGVHADGSQHYKEKAVDLDISGKTQAQVADMIVKGRQSGFTGFGIGGTHLHLDMRDSPNGAPVVFGDSYKGPIDGLDVNGWQQKLNGVQPGTRASAAPDYSEADKLLADTRAAHTASAVAGTNLQGDIANAQTKGISGQYGKAYFDTGKSVSNVVTDLVDGEPDANGKREKGSGIFSKYDPNQVQNAVNNMRAYAESMGHPINPAIAGQLVQNFARGKDSVWFQNLLNRDNIDEGYRSKALDDEIKAIGDEGSTGRFQQYQGAQIAGGYAKSLSDATTAHQDAADKLQAAYQAARSDPKKAWMVDAYKAQYNRSSDLLKQAVERAQELHGRNAPKAEAKSAPADAPAPAQAPVQNATTALAGAVAPAPQLGVVPQNVGAGPAGDPVQAAQARDNAQARTSAKSASIRMKIAQAAHDQAVMARPDTTVVPAPNQNPSTTYMDPTTDPWNAKNTDDATVALKAAVLAAQRARTAPPNGIQFGKPDLKGLLPKALWRALGHPEWAASTISGR